MLRERVCSALAGRRAVVVDLTGADSIDSATLSVLVSGVRRARLQGSALALAVADDPGSAVRRSMERTGMASIFWTFSSCEDAIEALSPAPLLPA
jgi:anti-anti-sigma factor